jgi:hypothetical protein
MSDDKPTRRDLFKPAQLLGLAFASALFAGIVTLISMGFFQQRGGDQAPRALQLALIIAGITFIAVLVILALLILAIDPAQVTKQIDGPVLSGAAEDASAAAAQSRAVARGNETDPAASAESGDAAAGGTGPAEHGPDAAASDDPKS